jgi:hypothetical protein
VEKINENEEKSVKLDGEGKGRTDSIGGIMRISMPGLDLMLIV